MSSRSFRLGRSITGLGLFATKPIKRGGLYRDLSRPALPNEEADRREARGAKYMFELNKQLDDRRLATMECRALHQPFLPAECEAGDPQGQDRDRGAAPDRAGRGNHLPLRAGISGLLPPGRRLPLRAVPHHSSRSPVEAHWREADRFEAHREPEAKVANPRVRIWATRLDASYCATDYRLADNAKPYGFASCSRAARASAKPCMPADHCRATTAPLIGWMSASESPSSAAPTPRIAATSPAHIRSQPPTPGAPGCARPGKSRDRRESRRRDDETAPRRMPNSRRSP